MRNITIHYYAKYDNSNETVFPVFNKWSIHWPLILNEFKKKSKVSFRFIYITIASQMHHISKK